MECILLFSWLVTVSWWRCVFTVIWTKWKYYTCNINTLLCAAVGTAGHQHKLKVCPVYGRSGSIFNNDQAVPDLSALNWPVYIVMFCNWFTYVITSIKEELLLLYTERRQYVEREATKHACTTAIMPNIMRRRCHFSRKNVSSNGCWRIRICCKLRAPDIRAVTTSICCVGPCGHNKLKSSVT